MKTIKFKCKLLSDIVFSQNTATEGSQQTLDFIPGSAIMGLLASKHYKEMDCNDAMLLFHSGKIQFGDAHPLINNRRTLRIPSFWFVEKGKKMSDGIYFQHLIANQTDKQLKQCRGGFAVFYDNLSFSEYSPNKRFSIKSAYDSEKRRSEDEKMYGYQSLVKGSEWGFDIQWDEALPLEIESLCNSLIGEQQIGKSKSSEYGRVLISKEEFETFYKISEAPEYCLLYAESRLMFFNENGQPTYEPTIEQLGIENGKINWEKSQIRTFQYAPFNSKRQTRDCERFGIEKGSVFYIEKGITFSVSRSTIEKGVGVFKNEGFGRMLVNPDFLMATANGELKYIIKALPEMPLSQLIEEHGALANSENELILSFLTKSKMEDIHQKSTYEEVESFISKYAKDFGNEKFASQWGTIRSHAMQSETKTQLIEKLFGEPNGFLTHGVSAMKWEERNRFGKLRDFIDGLDEAYVINTIINVASEMAKKSKEGNQ